MARLSYLNQHGISVCRARCRLGCHTFSAVAAICISKTAYIAVPYLLPQHSHGAWIDVEPALRSLQQLIYMFYRASVGRILCRVQTDMVFGICIIQAPESGRASKPTTHHISCAAACGMSIMFIPLTRLMEPIDRARTWSSGPHMRVTTRPKPSSIIAKSTDEPLTGHIGKEVSQSSIFILPF